MFNKIKSKINKFLWSLNYRQHGTIANELKKEDPLNKFFKNEVDIRQITVEINIEKED